MSKHTPGPWIAYEIAPDDPEWGACEIWPDENDREDEEGTVKPVATMVMGVENARLIAAAPELLDALIEAVKCGMVPISSAKDGGASTHSRQVRCADMIRAAIAKATGGAQ
ncbi:hypothetical protein [Stenotrophomonas maltophilia]|uniref:hypothetical protein n=1 Tax=Stenotrophomonas maltophilia TaxID=40324 RepID=UPI000B41DB5E|nr:hypothetical protein [Stenotrophomonas maltophilia]OWB46501.1 hypothetical protein B7H27_10210 [Stenotrophomonas maltophilia]